MSKMTGMLICLCVIGFVHVAAQPVPSACIVRQQTPEVLVQQFTQLKANSILKRAIDIDAGHGIFNLRVDFDS